jgi:hypothetical protein
MRPVVVVGGVKFSIATSRESFVIKTCFRGLCCRRRGLANIFSTDGKHPLSRHVHDACWHASFSFSYCHKHIKYDNTLKNGPNQENENGYQDVAKEASGPKECQEEQGTSQQGSRICGNEQGVTWDWIHVSIKTVLFACDDKRLWRSSSVSEWR